jgi:hypothetical protein
MTRDQILSSLGLDDVSLGGFAGEWTGSGPQLDVFSPIDDARIGTVRPTRPSSSGGRCRRRSVARSSASSA